MTLDEVKAASATLNDAIQALDLSAPAAPTVTEVEVKESDGTAETFVPETPTA